MSPRHERDATAEGCACSPESAASPPHQAPLSPCRPLLRLSPQEHAGVQPALPCILLTPGTSALSCTCWGPYQERGLQPPADPKPSGHSPGTGPWEGNEDEVALLQEHWVGWGGPAVCPAAWAQWDLLLVAAHIGAHAPVRPPCPSPQPAAHLPWPQHLHPESVTACKSHPLNCFQPSSLFTDPSLLRYYSETETQRLPSPRPLPPIPPPGLFSALRRPLLPFQVLPGNLKRATLRAELLQSAVELWPSSILFAYPPRELRRKYDLLNRLD